MKKESNKIDFSNQIIYVGIDVHKVNWSANIRSGGLELKRYTLDAHPEDLSKYLRRTYPGAKYKSVYEAGFSGFWAHRRLCELGIENIVVNPADVPTRGSERVQKTDPRDARKLARELESGNLRGIYIPTEADESLRSLSRLRQQNTKDMVREKNRIKSMTNRLGIELPANREMQHWSRAFLEHLRTLPFGQMTDVVVMESMITAMVQKRDSIAQIVRKLRTIVKADEELNKIIKLLMSVPGVGFVTAITLLTELIDIKRFKHLDELCSYVGLIPIVRSSGEKTRTLGISQRRSAYLRNMIIESAWVAVRNDPALLLYFNDLCKNKFMDKSKAIIRVAKKLLNRIMTVWSKQTPYVCSVVK
jgi:transposase